MRYLLTTNSKLSQRTPGTHCSWCSNYLICLLWLTTQWYTARIKSWRDLTLMPNIAMNACANCDGAKLIFKISVNKQKRLLRCNSNLYWKIHEICRISLAHTIKKWSKAMILPRATVCSSEIQLAFPTMCRHLSLQYFYQIPGYNST